jgi:Sec7-like guanine-nucleotide exchange factor
MTEEEKFMKKRLNYLECALIMDRLLDVRYFPAVVAALDKSDKSSFKKICNKQKIPLAMRDPLWVTLLDTNTRMANEPGWILK